MGTQIIHVHLHKRRTADNWEEGKHPRKDDGKFGQGGGTQGHYEAEGRKEAENAAAMKLRASKAKERKAGGPATEPRKSGEPSPAKKGEVHYTEGTDKQGRKVYKLYDKSGHAGTVASKKDAIAFWLEKGGAKAEAAYGSEKDDGERKPAAAK